MPIPHALPKRSTARADNAIVPALDESQRMLCWFGGTILLALSDGMVVLRPWRAADKNTLVRYANNHAVWINLKDRFPFPYSPEDADAWLARCATEALNPTHFAIEVQDSPVGGIGLEFLQDVYRLTAEIGYWVAEPFWGKGIATSALKQLTAHAFATFPLERLQASVFEWNPASARVLEKAGYTLEARLRRNIVKDGRMGDSLLFARLRDL